MVANNPGPIDVSSITVQSLDSGGDLKNRVCRALYAYWERHKGNGDFETFDLIEVPIVVPYLVVLDVVDDAPTFRFRMAGQSVVGISSKDLTGQLLGRTGTRAPLTLKFCDAVWASKGPIFTRDTFTSKQPGVTYRFVESLALPLFDGGGKLNHILLAHGPE